MERQSDEVRKVRVDGSNRFLSIWLTSQHGPWQTEQELRDAWLAWQLPAHQAAAMCMPAVLRLCTAFCSSSALLLGLLFHILINSPGTSLALFLPFVPPAASSRPDPLLPVTVTSAASRHAVPLVPDPKCQEKREPLASMSGASLNNSGSGPLSFSSCSPISSTSCQYSSLGRDFPAFTFTGPMYHLFLPFRHFPDILSEASLLSYGFPLTLCLLSFRRLCVPPQFNCELPSSPSPTCVSVSVAVQKSPLYTVKTCFKCSTSQSCPSDSDAITAS